MLGEGRQSPHGDHRKHYRGKPPQPFALLAPFHTSGYHNIMSPYQKNQVRSRRRPHKSPAKIIFAHDLNGNLTFMNRRGAQLLGYSGEEVCHMNISEMVEPEVARRLREQILNSAKKSIGVVYEVEVIAKDGHRVPLEISTSVVFREGQPIEIEGIAFPSTRCEEAPAISPRCLDTEFFYRIWLEE